MSSPTSPAFLRGHVLRTLVITAVLALTGALLAAPALARPEPVQPKGYGFDSCSAPSQRAMNAWHRTSHFSAVGIYIAGINRACDGSPT